MHTLIVGEIGINANGDIEIAKKLIDTCSNLGIPYVKFQKRTIELVYTKEELEQQRTTPYPEIKTNGDWKRKLEFSLEDYKEIDRYCKEKGNIKWFASPWDLKSIDFLCNNFPDMSFLKIPSAKMNDFLFLERCNDSMFPLVLSTGMCNYNDVLGALQVCRNMVFLLGCTSSYPTPVRDINLNQIKFLNHYFSTTTRKVGWSDHTGSVLWPSMAVGFGAKMIEVHITLDRTMYGSDQAASLEPQGLEKLVKYINAVECGLGNVIKEVMPSEVPIIKKLRGN